MRLELPQQAVAEIKYCLESMRWLARVYDNQPFAEAVGEVTRQLNEAMATTGGYDAEPQLVDLAYRRHEASATRRWVQLDDTHRELIQSAAHAISSALDDSTDFNLISLRLSHLVEQWDDAPSVCPREASCSSHPSCPCEGGIPV